MITSFIGYTVRRVISDVEDTHSIARKSQNALSKSALDFLPGAGLCNFVCNLMKISRVF